MGDGRKAAGGGWILDETHQSERVFGAADTRKLPAHGACAGFLMGRAGPDQLARLSFIEITISPARSPLIMKRKKKKNERNSSRKIKIK